jgi:hypothetical protein
MLSAFPSFKRSVTTAEGAEYSEYPLMAKLLNLWTVKEPVPKKRKITIHEVPEMFGISFGSRKSIFKDNLNYCQIAPCLLSEEQKGNCVNTCLDLQETQNSLHR